MTVIAALVRLWGRLRETYQRFREDDGLQLAAAVSYYAALSFFPLLLVLTAGLGLVFRFTGWGRDAQARLLDVVSEQVSPELASQIAEALDQVQSGAVVGGPLGALTLLFAAMAIFAQLDRALDTVWNIPRQTGVPFITAVRRILWHRTRAFLMMLAVGGLVVALFIAGVTFASVAARGEAVVEISGQTLDSLHTAVAILVNWLLFTAMHKALPRARVKWSAAARGGLLTALLWEVGRQLLLAYVAGRRFSAFGVIGSFIAILLWVYYGTASLLLGAEYTQVLCQAEQSGASGGSVAGASDDRQHDA